MRTCVLAALFSASAHAASAQIYSWRDDSGSLVLSNVAPGTNPGIASYEVEESGEVRTTQYVEPSRARPFDDIIDRHARRNGVRGDLVRAVIQVESAFNPLAVSNKGAMGLMQLMPATARQFGVRNAFDPEQNVRGGVAYLKALLTRYAGDERLALAAYNAGPGAVDRHGQTVPPYSETRRYVSKIKGLAGTRTDRPAAPEDGEEFPLSTHIYRVVEIIDGQEVVKFTDQPPTDD